MPLTVDFVQNAADCRFCVSPVQNAATGEWVVFAMGRKDRPKQTVVPKQRQKGSETAAHDSSCPFCVGNEHITPPTLLQYGGDPTTGKSWDLRVIDNKFPAVVCLDTAVTENPELVERKLSSEEDGTLDLSMLNDDEAPAHYLATTRPSWLDS
jgi:hypothetical protein